MIRYKKVQNTNSKSAQYKKWYIHSVVDDTLNTEDLAKHMANHNSPYSNGVISGVLKDMIKCIKELLLESKNVKLDDLAIFSVGIKSNPANSLEEFDINKNVKGLKLRARPTGSLMSASIRMDAQLKEIGKYSTDGVEDVEPTE